MEMGTKSRTKEWNGNNKTEPMGLFFLCYRIVGLLLRLQLLQPNKRMEFKTLSLVFFFISDCALDGAASGGQHQNSTFSLIIFYAPCKCRATNLSSPYRQLISIRFNLLSCFRVCSKSPIIRVVDLKFPSPLHLCICNSHHNCQTTCYWS